MIDAYVINLQKQHEKKQQFIQHSKDIPLHFIFVNAVDGEEQLSLETFSIAPFWYDRYLGTGITKGEIGCALSHYKAWEMFFQSNKECAFFFEDDISFTNAELITIFMTHPLDADIVYVLCKPLKQNIEYNMYFELSKASYWTCGYLLTRKGVEKLLKTNYKNNLIVVDEFLPTLYDTEYLSEYKKYYDNIRLNAYSIKKEYSFIQLLPNAFKSSTTFHSPYYQYNSEFICLIKKNIKLSTSSLKRFEQSCSQFSIQCKIVEDINKAITDIEPEKYIIVVVDPNYGYFVNHPAKYMQYEAYDEKCIFSQQKRVGSLLYKSSKPLVDCLSSDESMKIVPRGGMLLNGEKNPLLLNKYENYTISRVRKNYGVRVATYPNIYDYRIRIIVLAYESYYGCLRSLEKIDYPKELMSIFVYTDLFLEWKDVTIIKSTREKAYDALQEHSLHCDYIWIIHSNNVFTEPSILKDCISSDKKICSGLVIRPNTCFSNFWGNLSTTGWYKRSDDYLDILNQKIHNIWNVPFITGNVLIHQTMFEQDLFANKTFEDPSMRLCHNARLLNEGMYLLNYKQYGYIHPEYKSIEEWREEDIFTEHYLSFYKRNVFIFKEVKKGTDIWCFSFFRPEFCDYLIELAERNGKWSEGVYTKSKSIDKRIGAVENTPTQDIHLKDLGLDNWWNNVIVQQHFKKIMSCLYRYLIKSCNISFIVKYDAKQGQTSLKAHHDASVYTTNIALSNYTDYEGGKVVFHSKNVEFVNKDRGSICLRPGRITHYHEAFPITKGRRYILVSFNN